MLSSSLDIYIHIQYSDIHIYIYIFTVYSIYIHVCSHTYISTHFFAFTQKSVK